MEIFGAMSNHSIYVNQSIIFNESTLEDFTNWKAATAVILISQLFLSLPISLFINLSIIFIIVKTKSLRRPLNLIHLSMLILNCLIALPDIITSINFVPNAVRSCECPRLTSLVIFIIEQLYIVFQPLNFASLAVFLLLTMKGKKQFVSYKSVSASIAICSGLTILLVTETSTVLWLTGQTFVCGGVCPRQIATRSSGLVIFISYGIFCYVPSFLFVVVCTSWSYVIFEKNFISRRSDEHVSRRIILLPIVLPLVLLLPTIVSAFTLGTAENFLRSTEPDEFYYWILFTRFMISQLNVVVPRVVYPFILLLMNPPILRCWKDKNNWKCGRQNQVEPTSGTLTT